MRNGGTREVHLTFIVNSYDNGKTQTNYLGVKMPSTNDNKIYQISCRKIL